MAWLIEKILGILLSMLVGKVTDRAKKEKIVKDIKADVKKKVEVIRNETDPVARAKRIRDMLRK
jgi:hypothetical protein